MADTERNKKKKRGGVLGTAIVAIIALVIVIMISFKIQESNKEIASKDQVLDSINSQIESAKADTAELENEVIYRETDDYLIEEINDLFGLYKPDEVIFEAKDLENENK